MKRYLIFILSSILITSCMQPVRTEAPARYVLKGVSTQRYAVKPHALTLLVTQPSANPGYQSDEIIYVNKPLQLNNYTKNVWVAPPTQLLLPLLVESLRNTNYFHAVMSPPYVGDADLRLETNLITLQQEFFAKHSQVRMTLQATLINNLSNKILASQTFSKIVASTALSPYGGVMATDQATEMLMQEITAFVIKKARS